MSGNLNSVIGTTTELHEGGLGLRFTVTDHNPKPSLTDGQLEASIPAFVIAFDGQYFAYLNRCGHIAVQLDFMPGEFFSDDAQTLVCATHGAEYAPNTGACLGGPCFGVGLEPIEIEVQQTDIILTDQRYQLQPDDS
ncbi:MAG: Rieske 2Fe-2S domain-containing protein [Pseudomonadota bacterium]